VHRHLCAPTLAIVSVFPAPAKPTPLVKVYVGSDGLAHGVDGRVETERFQKKKIKLRLVPKLAADRQTAGWLTEQENCCTSYAIHTGLTIYEDGKKRLLGDGLLIYDWSFVGEGSQVALSTGAVHGMTSRHFLLYDSRTGKVLQEWNGELDQAPPTWAKDLSR
jgi:hypothetical protein